MAGLVKAEQAPPEKGRIGAHFNETLMSVNLVFRLVPRPLTMAIIASEMPAAIRPYSIAVAPDSSDQSFRNVRFKFASTRG